MEMQNEIQELTLSFFKTINSEITEDNGLYKVIIPEKYHNYFRKSQILITFDEKIAEQQNCELIFPGNEILFQIITNCTNKGPITLKQSKISNGNLVIRYHFFVNFSATYHSSQLFYIDVDLKTLKPVEIIEQLEEGDFVLIGFAQVYVYESANFSCYELHQLQQGPNNFLLMPQNNLDKLQMHVTLLVSHEIKHQ